MCKEDSLGIPRLGDIEDVKAITPASAYAHYRKLLHESPVEIFYVGEAPEQAAELLKAVFADMDRTPVAGIELSHNTYVDLFLRFGIVGACAVFIAVLTKGIKAWGKSKQTNSNETKNILLIKALYGVYGFTLSIYNGPEMVLLTWVFLFL